MNTPPKPNFSILARHLGPVLSLNGELTKYDQNLIFARNGTGKSFLSRAFCYLDKHGKGENISKAAFDLISDESPESTGSFSFLCGQKKMGTLDLDLDRIEEKVIANVDPDTIFHVFSEDFVHDELRVHQYNLDGAIDGEIANPISVDSENIKLEEIQKELEETKNETKRVTDSLSDKFEGEKIEELQNKANIHTRLKRYSDLSFEHMLEHYPEKPDPPEQNFAYILEDLDKLKSIPREPEYPDKVGAVKDDDIDFEALKDELLRKTSPSSVSEDIKNKIAAHHDFYKIGTKIVRDEHRTECPFCRQGITDSNPREIIDAYIAYFADEEEKHKSNLRKFFTPLNQKERELVETERHLVRQKSRYDALKICMPSKKDSEISYGEKELEGTRKAVATIKDIIVQKARSLATVKSLPADDLSVHIETINSLINANNMKVDELIKAIRNSDDERKTLQRNACTVFECKFAIRNWDKIEEIKTLQEKVKDKEKELIALEEARPLQSVRGRVAKTFKQLLKVFFDNQYVFDEDKFELKRGEEKTVRGLQRILSDGEKTIIAFCYFIACVHRKVRSNRDYGKLFLVFDDPVTSMSYDFIFSIAQILKDLRISDQGEVSINPSKIDDNKKPELLVLTHSSYFFNILHTNGVVKKDAVFALYKDEERHELNSLQDYVSPFGLQLRHVYEVANDGSAADYRTGNAIRSVLEAVGRFCRPDKSKSLQEFIQFINEEHKIKFKHPILIHTLSHGDYNEEGSLVVDMKQACKETLEVVGLFAPGQLAVIMSAD